MNGGVTGSWGLGAKWRYLHGHPAYQRSPLPTVLRLAEWRCRCALRISGTVRLQHNVRLRLPPNWRGVAKLLYAFGEAYEPELKYMAAMLRPGMVVVDVGASYGVYAAVAAKAVGPAGLVLAFENCGVTTAEVAAVLDALGVPEWGLAWDVANEWSSPARRDNWLSGPICCSRC